MYQYLIHDSDFNMYADYLEYEDGELYVSEKHPAVYVLLHTLSKTLEMEPVFLKKGNEEEPLL